MWGNSNDWDPEAYLGQRRPGVRVRETGRLPQGVLGCVDFARNTIWLARGLPAVERRCTLAYEVAQWEQGPMPEDPCLARAYQRAAEEWAALMLIPSETFAAAWACCLDLDGVAAFCSVDTATFRARIRAASDADQDAAMESIRGKCLSV